MEVGLRAPDPGKKFFLEKSPTSLQLPANFSNSMQIIWSDGEPIADSRPDIQVAAKMMCGSFNLYGKRRATMQAEDEGSALDAFS